MRQWQVDPKIMCRKHLLGEHVEHHMMVGCLNKKISVDGYVNDGLFEMDTIRRRHEALVIEMKRRRYNHQSPLPDFSYTGYNGKVDVGENIKELANRCEECRKRILNE